MTQQKHTAEQITAYSVRWNCCATGAYNCAAARQTGITKQVYCYSRNEYGGMGTADANA